MKKRSRRMAAAVLSISFLLLTGCVSTKVNEIDNSEAISGFDKKAFLEEVKAVSLEGRYDDALALYEKVPASFSYDKELNVFKVRLYDVSGNYSNGLELCTALYSKYPKDAEIRDLLVSLDRKVFMVSLKELLSEKKYDEAIASFDSLSEETLKEYDIQFLKASILASAGKLDDAQALCDELLKKDPNNVDAMSLAANIARMRGDSKTKSAYISQVLKKDPNNIDANVALAENSMSTKNYTAAQKYYSKALTKNPENEDVLLGVAITQYFLEQDDSCKATLNKILEINPGYYQAYYYLAKIADANREYKVAVNNIEKAIEGDEYNYNYYLDYGMYLRDIGRFDDAERAWTKAINLDPSYFLAYAYRAGIYDEQDQYKKAIDDYKQVVTLNPKYYYSYESLGVLALREKDYKTAREAFMKCREYNTTNVSYPLMVTYCYYMEGNELEAKKYSENAYRKLNNSTMEYKMLRAYHDLNGYQNFPQDIINIQNQNLRGKMYFYLGLLYSIVGGDEIATEYYAKVVSMNAAMFFEYRIAQWNTGMTNGK